MWRYTASLTILFLLAPFAFGATRKNILILHEGSRLLPYQSLLSNELQKNLGKTRFDIQIFDEYLDTWRLRNDPSYAIHALGAKYGDLKLDAVVVDGNAPFQVLLNRPPAFLKGTPVVFLTVPDYDLPSSLPPNMTGVTTHKEYGTTARLAMRLQPGLRHLFYVEGGLPSNQLRETAIHNELASLGDELDIVNLKDIAVDDLLERVRSLPPHSAILFDTYLHDPSGKPYVPGAVCDLIAKAANAPVYILFQTEIGKGATGGVLINFESVGEQGAKILRDLLAGESVSQHPVEHSRNDVIVDWREFQRFGFAENSLPPSAVILFRPPTLWEKYHWYITAAVFLMLLQTALIIELALAGKLRKRSERSARELASRLIDAQEVERRRIAGELHDDVSQRLALVAIHLDALRRSPPGSRDVLIRELKALYEETDLISSDIHQFSHELHPAVLDRMGLPTALRRYCTEFSEHRKITINMSVSGEERRLSPQTALAFFRIGQECLTNATKHSGATECKILLTFARNRLTLAVRDDGRGFDPKSVRVKAGLGIQSMRERLRYIGGSLRIKSSLRYGTTIIAEAPLAVADPLHTPEVSFEERPDGRSAAASIN